MIYLEDEQYKFLKLKAKLLNCSMAELVRKAVSLFISRERPVPSYLGFIGAGTGPEGGRTSEEDEKILKEIFK